MMGNVYKKAKGNTGHTKTSLGWLYTLHSSASHKPGPSLGTWFQPH